MPSDARPIFAAVVPFLTPFRVQFLQRVAREIPHFRVVIVLTQNAEHGPWQYTSIDELELLDLGTGKPWQHAARTWRALPSDWRTGSEVVRWLTRHHVAAVWLVGYAYLSHTRVVLACHKRGIPLFLWGDSNIRGDTQSAWKRWIKRLVLSRLLSRCAAVMPCGSAGRAFFERYGTRPDRMFLCPADPDYALIDHADPSLVRRTRERFALDPARKRILCCARLVGLKRFDAAIDAFVSLALDRPDWDLVIVGDGPCRKEWQARVPAHLTSRVVWTGFVKDPAEIAALYLSSHIFVHPGDYEAWGVVVLEAAAAGLALVVSEVVGAAADLVKDAENGRLVPPGDSRAIETALRDITRPEVLESMREASRRVSRAFRTSADAITGLRQALASARVHPS